MAKPLKAAKSAARDSKRKIAIPDRYTDEPTVAGSSSSAIPLLNHSDYGEDARDPDEELPSYSDNANETEDEGSDGDDPPPFAPYKPVVKKITTKLGMGDTLTVSHDPHLNTDGEALYRWLKEESLVPPKPEVHIKGTHQVRRRNGDKTETSTTTDFYLKLSLDSYLIEGKVVGIDLPPLKTVDPDKKTSRGGRWRTVATDVEVEQARTVRSWADQYCEDKSTLKEFIMKKSCVGWDLTRLKNEIEAIIRSTNYLGRISVDFPVFETRVEVFPSNRISRMRKNEYWRWLFYLTFLWVLAWPYLWYFTKRYHVAETVWHYTKLVQPEEQSYNSGPQRVRVNDEEEWLITWGSAIKRAARARRQGFVSSYDIEEMHIRAASRGQTGAVGPPLKTGNSAIDGALGIIAGVGAIANDMRLSRSEIIGWGGDEGW